MSPLDLIPVMAPGVFLHGRSPTYLGFTHRGLFLELDNQPELHALLASLMKSGADREVRASVEKASPSRSASSASSASSSRPSTNLALSALAETFAVSSDALLKFLRPLIAEGFIYLQIPLEEEYRTASVKSESLSSRIKSEESISGWRSPGFGREEILNRANFSILIFGKNRLALTIYSLLLASGFSHCKIISRDRGIQLARDTRTTPLSARRPSKRVEPSDIYGLTMRNSDIGRDIHDVMQDIRKSSSLLYFDNLSIPHTPDFIISAESTAPELSQRWISEAIAHIAITDLEESFIEVGPLVIPGATPCLHCVGLARTRDNPIYRDIELLRSLEKPREIPAGLVALISGAIVLEVAEFAATGNSSLVGSTARYDARNPSELLRQYWNKSEECGCTEKVIAR